MKITIKKLKQIIREAASSDCPDCGGADDECPTCHPGLNPQRNSLYDNSDFPEPGLDRYAGSQQSEPCPRCGSENTEQLEPSPSMAGYGEDSGLRCLDCKKISFSGPEMHG